MERISLELPAREPAAESRPPALCGVVSSGNLEVLVEPGAASGACRFEIETSAHGFGEVWQAVLRDFTERHAVGGLNFSINDAGATPAVVSLRLGQALDLYRGQP